MPEVKTTAVVGAGTMGRGIAQLFAGAGFHVLLFDVEPRILSNSIPLIRDEIRKRNDRGESIDEGTVLGRIAAFSSLNDLAPADLVVEAAIEDLSVKQDLFKSLSTVVQPGAILVSNTSSLSITSIASSVSDPGRVAGMHFFNPVHRMKLVELVRGFHTTDSTLATLVELTKLLGKTPIVVRDTPGFVVNRIARPFYGEALRLLGEGVASAEEIDRIVKLEGGFKMGPFELIDLIGVDVNLAVTASMYQQTHGEARYRPHPIQQAMVAAGLLGRKTGRGFHSYDR